MVQAIHPAPDFPPTRLGIAGADLVHRTRMHHLHLEIRQFEDRLQPLLRRHRAGAQDFFPIDRVLEILERGGMFVRIGHCKGLCREAGGTATGKSMAAK